MRKDTANKYTERNRIRKNERKLERKNHKEIKRSNTIYKKRNTETCRPTKTHTHTHTHTPENPTMTKNSIRITEATKEQRESLPLD